VGVNKNFMATITLTYNARSSKARMVLDMLMSTGLFKKKEEKPNAETMAAIKEAQSGKHAGVVDLSSLDAMVRSMQ